MRASIRSSTMPHAVDHSCSHAHERHHFDQPKPPTETKAAVKASDDTDEDDDAGEETQAKGAKSQRDELSVRRRASPSLTSLRCAVVGMSSDRQDIVLEISVDEHQHGHIEVRSPPLHRPR